MMEINKIKRLPHPHEQLGASIYSALMMTLHSIESVLRLKHSDTVRLLLIH